VAAALPHRVVLLGALIILVVLTLASWGMAALPLGSAGTVIALGIASLKATIVAIAFMEIRQAGPVGVVIAGVVVSFIVLLALGTIADVRLR
jgi:cytochrome c oxidase subunit 4